jgi:hypothetical protein
MAYEDEMLKLIRLRNAQRKLADELEIAPHAVVRRLATLLDELLRGEEADRDSIVQRAEMELAQLRETELLPPRQTDEPISPRPF